MLTCKENCFCYSVCTKFEAYARNPKLNLPNPSECIYFKDRSKVIDLPCKLGESLYAINGKGEIKSWKIICIRAIKSSIHWNPEHIEYTIGCEKNNGIMWVHLDKAKNIYFNSEEAEQALKEREKNEKNIKN